MFSPTEQQNTHADFGLNANSNIHAFMTDSGRTAWALTNHWLHISERMPRYIHDIV